MVHFCSMKKILALIIISVFSYQAKAQCVDPSLINPFAICPMIWMPVCGCDGVTYGNACEALNFGGVTDYTDGECGVNNCNPIPVGVDFGMCAMALGFAMTDSGCVSLSGCGYLGSDGIDYSGSFFTSSYECNQTCLGDTLIVLECIDSTLIDPTVLCPGIYLPVCGCDGITYPNFCSAVNYAGVTSYTEGECIQYAPACSDVSGVDFGDCDMALGWAFNGTSCSAYSGCSWLVNGIDYSGAFYSDIQSCLLTCADGDPCIDSTLINPAVDCIAIYDPVCGCNNVTYNNFCEAIYYGGVTHYSAGPCIVQVNENDTENLTVYPNPTNESISISMHGETFSFKLLNLSGEVLERKMRCHSNYTFSTTHLAAGVYILEVKCDSTIQRIRVVVN